jgi:Domain of unknown function (DUF4129)
MLNLKLSSRGALAAMCTVVVSFLLLILPLIGNIHSIEFQPGRGMEFSGAPASGGPPPVAPGASLVRLIVLVLLRVAVVVFIFLLITDWRYRTFYIVSILFLFGILLMVKLVGLDEMTPPETANPDSEERWERTIEEAQDIEPPDDRDVESSSLQYIVVAILLASIVAIVGIVLLRKWLKGRPLKPDDGQDEILASVTDAARRLRAGEDARTVVLFCYQEMTDILSTAGQIDATYLTPREFELRLRRLGMSGVSVTDLTSLFEVVRYAGRIDGDFADRALACLDTLREVHAFAES